MPTSTMSEATSRCSRRERASATLCSNGARYPAARSSRVSTSIVSATIGQRCARPITVISGACGHRAGRRGRRAAAAAAVMLAPRPRSRSTPPEPTSRPTFDRTDTDISAHVPAPASTPTAAPTSVLATLVSRPTSTVPAGTSTAAPRPRRPGDRQQRHLRRRRRPLCRPEDRPADTRIDCYNVGGGDSGADIDVRSARSQSTAALAPTSALTGRRPRRRRRSQRRCPHSDQRRRPRRVDTRNFANCGSCADATSTHPQARRRRRAPTSALMGRRRRRHWQPRRRCTGRIDVRATNFSRFATTVRCRCRAYRRSVHARSASHGITKLDVGQSS